MAKRKYIAAPGHTIRRPGSGGLAGGVRRLSEDPTQPYEVEAGSKAGQLMALKAMRGEVVDVTDRAPERPKPVAKPKPADGKDAS